MAELSGLSDGGRYGAEAGDRCNFVEVWPQDDTLLLIWVCSRENGECFVGTGVIEQMRDAGRDVAIVVSLHGQMVLQLLAVPHPGLTIEDKDRGLVCLVQMRPGPCSRRHSQQMPRDPTLSAEIPAK